MTENLNPERAEIVAALSAAGAFCGECGFQPGETGCQDCVRVRDLYADAVMPIVERQSGAFAPTELATWAEQLQSAGLTPHPAFACRSTTSGYEAAMQVATTDQLTDAARERLLAALQVAFDETVRRVLGYRPAALGAGQCPPGRCTRMRCRTST